MPHKRKAKSSAGESPWSLSNNGVMTVPPWEFFERVLGMRVLGDTPETGKLRGLAGAVSYRVRGPGNAAERLVTILELAAESGSTVPAAIASIGLLHRTGSAVWRDGAIVLVDPGT